MTACEKQYIDVAKTSPKTTLKIGCAENVAVISEESGRGNGKGDGLEVYMEEG
jgi:hypothetical protein